MKFIGENVLRLNRETVMHALVESFQAKHLGADLQGVEMVYHSNGDVSLTFEPRPRTPKAPPKVETDNGQ